MEMVNSVLISRKLREIIITQYSEGKSLMKRAIDLKMAKSSMENIVEHYGLTGSFSKKATRA